MVRSWWATAIVAGALALGGVACGDAAGDVGETSSGVNDATCGLDPTAPASLRTLMDATITTPEDADRRFGCLSEMLRVQKDRRAPFATLYGKITTAVRSGVAAGRFEDGAWVRTYLIAFAELYREAFVGWIDRKPIPAAWRIAFDTARARHELIVQDLSLGVNAHVNRDLSHALVLAGIGSGSVRDRRKRDHFAVNAILHEQLDPALTTIAEEFAPGLGKAPGELRSLLEAAYFDALVVGRRKAWDDAVILAETPGFLRFLEAEQIEGTSTALAEGILAPTLDPGIYAALKALEGS